MLAVDFFIRDVVVLLAVRWTGAEAIEAAGILNWRVNGSSTRIYTVPLVQVSFRLEFRYAGQGYKRMSEHSSPW